MSGSRLLLGSSLTDRTLLPVDGQPAILQHERLKALLAERAPRAAEMFAEPWADAKDGQPITRVSWYARAGEDPVAFEALPTSQRLAAENALRGRMADLVPLFGDPAAGPLVRAALSLPGRGDILWTGETPVLVNWGVVPAEVGEDPAALARHFDEVFRDMVPGGANPWSAAVPPAPPPAAPAAAAAGAAAALGTGAALAAAGGGGSAPPPPAPVGPPAAGEPGWRRPMSAATAILAATAIVLLVSAVALAAGFYYGWVQLARQIEATAPVPRDPAFDADLKRIQEGVNDGLRRRLAQLEAALRGDICVAPDGPLPAAPTRPGDPSPRSGAMSPIPALPPAPDQQPVQRPQAPAGTPAVPGAGQTTNLADLLEDSTVLVLAPAKGQGDGLSTGSGFAISPDIVVTNLHVVDKADPKEVYVANRKLGKPVLAEVIARTANHDIGKPDFAVLKLSEGQLPPLALSPTVDRLLPVVAVGFPGVVTHGGDDFKRLVRGDGGPMPPAHFTSGEVAGLQAMQGAQLVIHTAAITGGNSGGPLADRCGRVVGVNTFGRTDSRTAYRADYALPTATLLAFLQQNNVTARSEDTPCTPAAPAPAALAPAPAAPAPAPAAPPAAPAAPAAPR